MLHKKCIKIQLLSSCAVHKLTLYYQNPPPQTRCTAKPIYAALLCARLHKVHRCSCAPRGCCSAATQLHYLLCCHGNEACNAHATSMAEPGTRARGYTRAKFCYAAERNLSLGQQGSRGDIRNAREKARKRNGE